MKDSITEYFTNEQDYPDFDLKGAVDRFCQAIRCKTINYKDHGLTDYSEFDKLHQLIKESYPHIMAAGTFEVIGHHSILITIPGTDSSLKPALFMSHQDVVPVVEGTEDDWEHPAFSGDIADGFIWGRGSEDVKCQVFGTMEAVEYLLAHGKTFQRTTYLSFGDDEETISLGAQALAATLKERGVHLEFLLDEGGGGIVSAERYGAPDHVLTEINLMEKGFADVRVLAESEGGHSAFPFEGSSLGRVCQAVARIVEHPFPAHLGSAAMGTFKAIAPYVSQEPLKTLVQDVEGNAQAIADYCLTKKELFPYVTTTIAPTMIKGGSAASNVMPHNVEAIVNMRVAQDMTTEQVLTHVKQAVGDDIDVSLSLATDRNPSKAGPCDGYGIKKLEQTLNRYLGEVIVLPSMAVGGTDAHHYEAVCDNCLRYTPFMGEPEDVTKGVHGTNEKIPVRAFEQGLRIMTHLIENTVVNP